MWSNSLMRHTPLIAGNRRRGSLWDTAFAGGPPVLLSPNAAKKHTRVPSLEECRSADVTVMKTTHGRPQRPAPLILPAVSVSRTRSQGHGYVNCGTKGPEGTQEHYRPYPCRRAIRNWCAAKHLLTGSSKRCGMACNHSMCATWNREQDTRNAVRSLSRASG